MNKKNIFIYISLILILIMYIIVLVPRQFQNDTLFDISLGEKYLNEGLNTHDDFSIHENLEYTPQHLVVNILTYFIYNNLGFNGLYIWCIILTCIFATLLYIANKLFTNNKILSYLLVFIQLALLSLFISLRAQMYSYIFFLLEIIFIEKFLRSKKKIYLFLLSILSVFIINFHAGTIYFYYIIIFVYLLNYINIKTSKIAYHKEYVTNLKYLFIPIILSIFLIFINPFGINQLTYAFKTLNNSFISQNIFEFQPITIKSNIGLFFYAYLGIILLSFIYTKKKINLEHILLLLGTAFMTLLSLRHFSLFIICTLPCIRYLEDIIDKFKNWIYKGVSQKGKLHIKLIVIVFILATSFIYVMKVSINQGNEYLPKSYYPINSVNYIKENIGNDSRLFNEYSYGSLLMFNNIKVFIDSRADLYTEEYNKNCEVANDYSKIIHCSGNYEELLNKYNIEYLLISKNSSLAQNIFNNKKYEKIFEDDISYVIKVIT